MKSFGLLFDYLISSSSVSDQCDQASGLWAGSQWDDLLDSDGQRWGKPSPQQHRPCHSGGDCKYNPAKIHTHSLPNMATVRNLKISLSFFLNQLVICLTFSQKVFKNFAILNTFFTNWSHKYIVNYSKRILLIFNPYIIVAGGCRHLKRHWYQICKPK